MTSNGGRTIHLSGLLASIASGELVGGGNMAAQLASAYITVWQSLALAVATLTIWYANG